MADIALDRFAEFSRRCSWRPADVAERVPKPALDIAWVWRYGPADVARRAVASPGLFVALLGATSMLLWNDCGMSLLQQVLGAADIVAGFCVVGRISERRAAAVA